MRRLTLLAVLAAPLLHAPRLAAQPVFFSTGDVDRRIGIGARPASAGKLEIEAGDDFLLGHSTRLTSASFTGLVPLDFTSADAIFSRVQIYQVFPNNSTNPPSGNVPTRDNSPADNALLFRETGAGLTFTSTVLASTFTAANSVLNGIHGTPTTTTGEGAVTGQEVRFDVTFTDPINLAAGHYFFVPQIGLSTGGDFFWLSAIRPIVAPGTPFAPDLQSWIRNEELAPDWVRVGTDIIGAPAGGGAAPTFDQAFAIVGTETPEPSSFVLAATGLALAGWMARRRRAS
jgi:hypothetical protein